MSTPWGGGAYTPLAGQKWLPGDAVIPDLPTVIFKHRQAGIWVSRTAVPKVYLAGAWEVKIPQRWTGSDWVSI